MGEVSKFGRMAQSIKVFGRMIKLKGEVGLFTVMAMFMKANGKMIKQTARVYIFIFLVLHTKEIGWMINNTDLVYKSGKMELIIKEITDSGKSMGRGNLYGRMVQDFKEISIKMGYKVKVYIDGRTEDNTQGNGKIIRCMGKGHLNGQITEFTKGTI